MKIDNKKRSLQKILGNPEKLIIKRLNRQMSILDSAGTRIKVLIQQKIEGGISKEETCDDGKVEKWSHTNK